VIHKLPDIKNSAHIFPSHVIFKAEVDGFVANVLETFGVTSTFTRFVIKEDELGDIQNILSVMGCSSVIREISIEGYNITFYRYTLAARNRRIEFEQPR